MKKLEEKNILTISATDWFSITGNNPEDYRAIGIQYGDLPWSKKFQEEIPENTEVIVNFGISSHDVGCMSYGTALIPKKKR